MKIAARTAIVASNITDLRSKPQKRDPKAKKDLYQETQLLLGSMVKILNDAGDWLEVEAPGQLIYRDGQLFAYRGWIRKDDLRECASERSNESQEIRVVQPNTQCWSLEGEFIGLLPYGAPLWGQRVADRYRILLPNGLWACVAESAVMTYEFRGEAFVRESFVKSARSFINSSYVWGGHSHPADPCSSGPSGVDCSGLVSLLLSFHKDVGPIPRNSADQKKDCLEIAHSDLIAGDLVFMTASNESTKVDHVMIYSGEGNVIEATAGVGIVREVPLLEKVGVPLNESEAEWVTDRTRVSFGRIVGR